jgi:hypothetical protein
MQIVEEFSSIQLKDLVSLFNIGWEFSVSDDHMPSLGHSSSASAAALSCPIALI